MRISAMTAGKPERAIGDDLRAATLTIVAKRAFDSDSFQSLTARTNSVVDGARIACGRTLGAVARIPQITSLEPRKLRLGPAHLQRHRKLFACRLARAYRQIIRTRVETACPCSKASSIPRTTRLRWSRT